MVEYRAMVPPDPITVHLVGFIKMPSQEELARMLGVPERFLHDCRFKCIEEGHEQGGRMDRDHERKPDAQEVRGEPTGGDGTAGTDTEGP